MGIARLKRRLRRLLAQHYVTDLLPRLGTVRRGESAIDRGEGEHARSLSLAADLARVLHAPLTLTHRQAAAPGGLYLES